MRIGSAVGDYGVGNAAPPRRTGAGLWLLSGETWAISIQTAPQRIQFNWKNLKLQGRINGCNRKK